MFSDDLLHRIHGPPPIIDLLVWVSYIDDGALYSPKDTENDGIQVLRLVDHDVLHI
jgi:hypothetical protein